MIESTISIQSKNAKEALEKKRALLKLSKFPGEELAALAKLSDDPTMTALLRQQI